MPKNVKKRKKIKKKKKNGRKKQRGKTGMIITTHALERYCERIMDKDKKDIPVYVTQNKDKIEAWITKLYENSEYVCSGKIKDNNISHYHINNDGWVLVLDIGRDKIVTLYKIDLDVGSEFNKEYIGKIKERLKEGYGVVKATETALREANSERDNQIRENNYEISVLKKNTQLLEESNRLLTQEKIVGTKDFELKTQEFNHQIERFIGSRIL